ncbi:uncharacterized protein [Nicotiana tomentosiformis]|uniref:uncharacterized protein n=1 Tax=Nicotiana tomentosiformis TaxID=4098 RepID=UPI00388CAEFA
MAHKLPTNPMCPSVNKKLRKFKPDLSLKIKEEVTKHIKAKVLIVVEYLTWLANIVPVPKKDGNVRKGAATSWTEECQKAFDMIKEYLSKPPDLVPPEPGRPLLLYLSVLDGAFNYVLGQHNETKTMPKGKLAKWQILLSEFYIIYVTQKAVKGQALADHLAENPVGGEYEPLKTYFPDEEVSFVGEDTTETYKVSRMFFDGAANFKGAGIGAVLVSETGQHYPVSAKLRFSCTNHMAEYEACILGIKLAIDMNIQEFLVIGDSDLLVHQVLGE